MKGFDMPGTPPTTTQTGMRKRKDLLKEVSLGKRALSLRKLPLFSKRIKRSDDASVSDSVYNEDEIVAAKNLIALALDSEASNFRIPEGLGNLQDGRVFKIVDFQSCRGSKGKGHRGKGSRDKTSDGVVLYDVIREYYADNFIPRGNTPRNDYQKRNASLDTFLFKILKKKKIQILRNGEEVSLAPRAPKTNRTSVLQKKDDTPETFPKFLLRVTSNVQHEMLQDLRKEKSKSAQKSGP